MRNGLLKSCLRGVLHSLGFDVSPFARALLARPHSRLMADFPMALAHLWMVRAGKIRFLQVGACDGVLLDPLYPMIEKLNLSGIFCEPQKEAFEALKANHADRQARMVFKNVAIGDASGTGNLFRLNPSVPEPDFLSGCASFSREHLAALVEANGLPRSAIVEEAVAVMTFDALDAEADLSTVDVLVLDTEGYDARLLALYDLPRRRPALIYYEHLHLRGDEQAGTVASLVELGYQVLVEPAGNTLAYLHPAMS
jgi:FkbM family methyltransferase